MARNRLPFLKGRMGPSLQASSNSSFLPVGRERVCLTPPVRSALARGENGDQGIHKTENSHSTVATLENDVPGAGATFYGQVPSFRCRNHLWESQRVTKVCPNFQGGLGIQFPGSDLDTNFHPTQTIP